MRSNPITAAPPRGPGGWRLRLVLTLLSGLLLLPSAAGAQALRAGDEPNGEYPGYWSWPAIVRQLEQWEWEHRQLFYRTTIGYTSEGREIPAVKISLNARIDDTEKPEILILAGIHPREQQPQLAVMRLMQELLAGYGTDERIRRLVDTRAIWIIPIFNVDAKVYDFQNGNGRNRGANWRISRRVNDDGSIGVDLNRNFSYMWGGAGSRPGSGTYHGPAPLSEPETQALERFFEQRRFRVFLDVHSSMHALLPPMHLTEEERARYVALADGVRAVQPENPYRASFPPADTEPAQRQTGYSGASNGWGFYIHGAYSFGFETGVRGFYPAPEEIHRHYETHMREPFLYLIEAAGELPEPRPGDVTLASADTDRSPTPGATVEWTPALDGEVAYGVLVSWEPKVRVTAEYRLFPLRSGGFRFRVAEDLEPGTRVPLTLYLWDRERQRSVIDFTITIEGSQPSGRRAPAAHHREDPEQ